MDSEEGLTKNSTSSFMGMPGAYMICIGICGSGVAMTP